ncbi:MAG: serpin family protein [Lachnospiraceae bacterium]|nr:serpin family protein [Lachnospiraceae bacterium]
MKKKVLQMIGVLTATVMIAGCTNPGKIPAVTGNPDSEIPVTSGTLSGESVNLTEGRTGIAARNVYPTDEETSALSGAAFALFEEVMDEKEGENVLLSPVSIDFALGMTENGAAGNTLAQMEETVNGGISGEKLNPIMKLLSERFMNAAEVKWNVANSVWFKNDDQIQMKMKDDFLDQTVGYYDADVYLSPFDNRTISDINNWVSLETDGMITDVLDSIDPNTIMYLINAISFDGEWATEYEEDKITEDREFRNLDGSISKVTMLGSTESRYFEIAGGEGFIKPYKGLEYSFVGILPGEGETPESLIAKMNQSNTDFANAVKNAENTEVKVQMPEFSCDFETELSDTYKKMGMTEPFSETDADFSRMLESTDGSLFECWIGSIIHKTHIDVDRKGTKAAAVTVVEMRYKNAVSFDESKTIILNRPFVYAIVENETGLPVFLGCVNNME